jgi:hypothetical protein
VAVYVTAGWSGAEGVNVAVLLVPSYVTAAGTEVPVLETTSVKVDAVMLDASIAVENVPVMGAAVSATPVAMTAQCS